MTVISVLYFVGAILCLGLVCLVLFRDHRSFEHRVFAVGMTVLSLEAVFCGLSVTGVFPEDVGRWQRWRWGAAPTAGPTTSWGWGCTSNFSTLQGFKERRTMKLSELNHDEVLALMGLLKAVIRADREYSSEEAAEVEGAAEAGSEVVAAAAAN